MLIWQLKNNCLELSYLQAWAVMLILDVGFDSLQGFRDHVELLVVTTVSSGLGPWVAF